MGRTHSYASSFFWSGNLFFLIPLLAALFFGVWDQFAILALVILISTLHSHTRFLVYKQTDVLASITLIMVNLNLVYQGGFTFPYFHFAAAFVLPAFYFLYLSYKCPHRVMFYILWHLFSAFITLFSLFTFIY